MDFHVPSGLLRRPSVPSRIRRAISSRGHSIRSVLARSGEAEEIIASGFILVK